MLTSSQGDSESMPPYLIAVGSGDLTALVIFYVGAQFIVPILIPNNDP